MVWSEHVFQNPQRISITNRGEERDLVHLELDVDRSSFNKKKVEFNVLSEGTSIGRFSFNPGSASLIDRLDSHGELIVHGKLGQDGSLEDLLRIRPPTFFLADFSTIVGRDWYRQTTTESLDQSYIRTFDAFGKSVDIEREFENARPGMKTIHEFTESEFLAGDPAVVIYDHRSGEIADYISLREQPILSFACWRIAKAPVARKRRIPKRLRRELMTPTKLLGKS